MEKASIKAFERSLEDIKIKADKVSKQIEITSETFKILQENRFDITKSDNHITTIINISKELEDSLEQLRILQKYYMLCIVLYS